jgi:hypothetical protein
MYYLIEHMSWTQKSQLLRASHRQGEATAGRSYGGGGKEGVKEKQIWGGKADDIETPPESNRNKAGFFLNVAQNRK